MERGCRGSQGCQMQIRMLFSPWALRIRQSTCHLCKSWRWYQSLSLSIANQPLSMPRQDSLTCVLHTLPPNLKFRNGFQPSEVHGSSHVSPLPLISVHFHRDRMLRTPLLISATLTPCILWQRSRRIRRGRFSHPHWHWFIERYALRCSLVNSNNASSSATISNPSEIGALQVCNILCLGME